MSPCSWTAPSTCTRADRRPGTARAEERLYNLGWDVVRFPHDGDWEAICEESQFPYFRRRAPAGLSSRGYHGRNSTYGNDLHRRLPRVGAWAATWVVLPEKRPRHARAAFRLGWRRRRQSPRWFPSFEEVHSAQFRAAGTQPTPGDAHGRPACCGPPCESGSGPAQGPFPVAGRYRPSSPPGLPARTAADGTYGNGPLRLLISDGRRYREKTVEAGLIATRAAGSGAARRGLAVLLLTRRWPSSGRRSCAPSSALTPSSCCPPTVLPPGTRASTSASPSSTDHPKRHRFPPTFIKSARHRDDFVRHCPDPGNRRRGHTPGVAADGHGPPAQKPTALRAVAARRRRHRTAPSVLGYGHTATVARKSAFRNLLGVVKTRHWPRSTSTGRWAGGCSPSTSCRRKRADVSPNTSG